MPDPNPEPEADAAVTAAAGLPEHYFELYKLAVEMADRISARRGAANGFFLTINTGLVALVGSATLRWYVAAAGIVFSSTWWLLLKSYRRLNTAKFSVIIEMEAHLPKQLFGDEYRHYRESGQRPVFGVSSARRRERIAAWTSKFRELGEVERVVPIIFGLIYTAEIVRQVAS